MSEQTEIPLITGDHLDHGQFVPMEGSTEGYFTGHNQVKKMTICDRRIGLTCVVYVNTAWGPDYAEKKARSFLRGFLTRPETYTRSSRAQWPE